MWQNSGRVIHDDRVNGSEEHSDEGHGDGTSYEGRYEPDYQLQTGVPGERNVSQQSIYDDNRTYPMAHSV